MYVYIYIYICVCACVYTLPTKCLGQYWFFACTHGYLCVYVYSEIDY